MRIPTAESIRSGDRSALARAITVAESSKPEHRSAAAALLDELLPATGKAIRVGISGTPGVGKSSFIEALGLRLVGAGHRVAVLAIDPSSKRTGGSILGDRTRMVGLSAHTSAYIRSSPSGGELGGVAAQTTSAIAFCEAAGFDIVIVETVGVGQSETTVADLTDIFLLLVAPMGGDDLQGIKRGVMEMADIIAINKADGASRPAADITANDYRSALSLVRPKWPGHPTEVHLCSALENEGIAEVWDAIEAHWERLTSEGIVDTLRREQASRSFWTQVTSSLVDRLVHQSSMTATAEALEEAVRASERSPAGAASALVDTLVERL